MSIRVLCMRITAHTESLHQFHKRCELVSGTDNKNVEICIAFLFAVLKLFTMFSVPGNYRITLDYKLNGFIIRMHYVLSKMMVPGVVERRASYCIVTHLNFLCTRSTELHTGGCSQRTVIIIALQ